jgi:hypothetical protein
MEKWKVIDNGWTFEVVDRKGHRHSVYSQSVFYSKEEAQEEADYRNNNECQVA